MEKTEICEKVIKDFNNKLLPGCKEALLVKFADSSSRRKKITGAWGAAAAAAAIAAGVDPRWVKGSKSVKRWQKLNVNFFPKMH